MPDRIEAFFAESDPPAPRADLIDQILSAAKDQAPLAKDQAPLEVANDRAPSWTDKGFWTGHKGFWVGHKGFWVGHKGFWAGITAIAATLVAGFLVMTSQPSEADLWASHADDSGFGELYAWVYADTAETQ